MLALITSADFFAVAAEINFNSHSNNFQFDAEVGAPAVGRSVSSQYIFDHGAYWDSTSTTNVVTPVTPVVTYSSSAGGVGEINIPSISSSTTVATTSEDKTETVISRCGINIYCVSVGIIQEVEYISNKIRNDQSNVIVVTDNFVEILIKTIRRNVIYLSLAIILIMIITALFLKLNQRLNKFRIKQK